MESDDPGSRGMRGGGESGEGAGEPEAAATMGTAGSAWGHRASRRAAYPDAPDWQLEAWVSTYTAIADGSCATVTDAVERVTGRPARTLEQTLEG